MTDYSDAGSIKTEKPMDYKFDFLTVKDHNLTLEWVYPEFQSICPVSGRHDQGTIKLIYKPKEKLLESKSVRDYLRLWRNLHIWQEHVTEEIADTLFRAVDPIGLIIEIEWTPRGGIYAKTISRKGEYKKIID
jgi:7-cyano-7-deazaguanine reductase